MESKPEKKKKSGAGLVIGGLALLGAGLVLKFLNPGEHIKNIFK
jgi:hypothetical protein